MSVSSKKLINSVDKCVDECLEGLAGTFSHLVLHTKHRVVFDGTPKGNRKVGIVCGGGSGHEPFSAGYVGRGMLTASISGSVFASPPPNNIYHAIECVAERYEGGVLVIVPNYTGDVLNFGQAVEMARCKGYKVESIEVGEDIALLSQGITTRAGNRGMCGLVVLMKIAGYMSDCGESLDKIKETCESVLENIASMGVSLTACSLPGDEALFDMNNDEIELGTGVHGEAGIERIKLQTADQVVRILVEKLTRHLKLIEDDEIIVVVNNLGALTQLEQWLVTNAVKKQLIKEKRMKIKKIIVGSLFTSLNMSGVQITILKITDSLFLTALEAETIAPAWPCKQSARNCEKKEFENVKHKEKIEKPLKGPKLDARERDLVKHCLLNCSKAIIKNESKLNDLDSGCGDGDCGTTLRHLADDILKSSSLLSFSHPANLLCQLADIAQSSMGGTSGAIYSLFFTTASSVFENVGTNSCDAWLWSTAWRAGLRGILKYSRARIGDRTLLDALEPACSEFEKCLTENKARPLEALKLAVQSAEQGCDSTNMMSAAAGRASYVDKSQLKQVDAGAYGITIWLNTILETLEGSAEIL